METNSPAGPARKRSKLPIIVMIVLAAAAVTAFAFLLPSLFAVNDTNAVEFGASVNATSLSQNQTLRVHVSVTNGLSLINTVPLSGEWKVQNLSMGPCAFYEYYPYGVAVYQGRYTLDNISSGTQLEIHAPGFYSCGILTNANTFTFKQHQNDSSYVDLRGYYTNGETAHPGGGVSEGVLHPFVPGVYTVVAGDEWGHIKVFYFQVGYLRVSTGPPITVIGSIFAPNGSGNGTLEIQITDNQNDPITIVTFTNAGLSNASTIANVGSLELLYQGRAVSPNNPVPAGATAAGSLVISNVTAGVVYELNIKVTFESGGTQFETTAITAQI